MVAMPSLIFQSALVAAAALVVAFAGNAAWAALPAVLGLLWLLGLGPVRVCAHGHRVLIRCWFTDTAILRQGVFWLWRPEYVDNDHSNFGPWTGRKHLPLKGQILEIDVPEVIVSVDGGVYALKVNTKVVGQVMNYTVEDLVQNPIRIETHMHDVIANMLRKSVFDKPLEAALSEIQHLFLRKEHEISELLAAPSFQPMRLMLDADQQIMPADTATATAMQLVAQRKQEVARRAVQEEAHVSAMHESYNQLVLKTEEQKVHAVQLQMQRDELMLQKETYGTEGAAQVEVAKAAKAAYLFSGSSASQNWNVLPSA